MSQIAKWCNRLKHKESKSQREAPSQANTRPSKDALGESRQQGSELQTKYGIKMVDCPQLTFIYPGFGCGSPQLASRLTCEKRRAGKLPAPRATLRTELQKTVRASTQCLRKIDLHARQRESGKPAGGHTAHNEQQPPKLATCLGMSRR